MTLADEFVDTEDFLQDPYPAYRRLRSEAPVVWSARWSSWIITRHADAVAVLRNAQTFSNVDRFAGLLDRLPQTWGRELAPLREHVSLGVSNTDPPDHARLRSLANAAFQPRAIAALRPRVGSIVEELLAPAAEAGHMDVVHDLAFPLPAIAISELLGVPAEDRTRFRQWIADTEFHGSPDASDDGLLARARRASSAIVTLTEWLRPMIEQRRQEPAGDLLSHLVNAEEQGEVLSEAELVTICIILVRAGHITTRNLIANSVLALVDHPEQMALLVERPSLMPQAVEEFLRYDAPMVRTLRRVAFNTAFGGSIMAQDQIVSVMLGAANRDPERFRHPEQLDITRVRNRHLSFGHGIHTCLGAALSRLEAEVALSALIKRWPGLCLASPTVRYAPDNVMHTLESLPVALSA